MGDRSKIEWTDATWNPVTGCTRVSPGCEHCYIDWAPPFRIAGRHFVDSSGTRSNAIGSTTGVALHPERVDQPLRWKKPRRIFVNSMSDLFHEDVPDALIVDVFAVMARAARHTFQVLTKRHARMRSLLNSQPFRAAVLALYAARWGDAGADAVTWPLLNVWVGVTVEDQERADLRIRALMETRAAVRFLSCEPMLGPVDLTPCHCRAGSTLGCARHNFGSLTNTQLNSRDMHVPAIDWVICGGESGPGARPMHPEWARSLRDQCSAAGVPFLFKQWGDWQPYSIGAGFVYDEHPFRRVGDPITSPPWDERIPGRQIVKRVGKRAAGRELDGRTWDEYPHTSLPEAVQ